MGRPICDLTIGTGGERDRVTAITISASQFVIEGGIRRLFAEEDCGG